ncbi:hypothetical protein ANN_17492 [Periplaneta americana]|uniref:Uncharacterized protein n=1 Tax=Periplaneta americana TaxID=6978 RepID=A0ABQ8ST35_PERAM|nr:hypothetical protein ANN_17492 [Periplaneta americana]
MAGLCEGGNEPPGSLKDNINNNVDGERRSERGADHTPHSSEEFKKALSSTSIPQKRFHEVYERARAVLGRCVLSVAAEALTRYKVQWILKGHSV